MGCSSPFGLKPIMLSAYVFDGSLLLVLVVVHGVYCIFASRFKFLCVYSAMVVVQGDSLP